MKVLNKIDVYEENGVEVHALHRPQLEIESHWNRDEFVILVFGEKKITVSADDLRRAITNATNHR